MDIYKLKFSLVSIVLVLFFWVLVALIENALNYHTISLSWNYHPHQLLAPMCLSLLLIVFGLLVDWYIHKLQKREDNDRLEIYRASVWASHHVLNNFLNKLYLVQHNALQKGMFDEESSEMMGRMIQEAANQLLDLSRVEPITAEAIRKSVAP